jgi:hypothetical protein
VISQHAELPMTVRPGLQAEGTAPFQALDHLATPRCRSAMFASMAI